MLPVVTEDVLPPLETPRVPELDDEALAQALAELDGGEQPGTARGPAPRPPDRPAPRPSDRPAPTARPPIPPPGAARRTEQYRPPVRSAPEPPSLTGLTRRSLGGIGSKVFTTLAVGIFLLILLQVVVSILGSAG